MPLEAPEDAFAKSKAPKGYEGVQKELVDAMKRGVLGRLEPGGKKPVDFLPKLAVDAAVKDTIDDKKREIKCGDKTWTITYDKKADDPTAKAEKLVTPDGVEWTRAGGAWEGKKDGKVVGTASEIIVNGKDKDVTIDFVGLKQKGTVSDKSYRPDNSSVERFGQNSIVRDKDGEVTTVFHKGKRLDIEPDGQVKGIRGMRFDSKTQTLSFESANGRITLDPVNDKTTVELKRGDKKTTEITDKGVSYYQEGKLTRFEANDRSFSIDFDKDGKATVNGKDGKAMRAGDPHEDLLKLNGKVPTFDAKTQSLTVDEGGDKRTYHLGSHNVLRTAGGDVKEVQYGKRTWAVEDDGAGNFKIKSNEAGAAEHKVPKADVKFAEDGSFTAKLPGGKQVLEVDPKSGTEKTTEGDKATVKHAEAAGRRPYEVKMEKDAKGNWGVTEVKDERGIWTFTYDGASRAAADLKKVNGPAGEFEKGKNCTAIAVGEKGNITVGFDKGDYRSVSIKPGANEEVYTAKDGHKIKVKYETVGEGAAAKVKPTEVNDGSRTFKAVYDKDANLTGLRVGDRFYSTAGREKNAESIDFDPKKNVFKVKLDDAGGGATLEFDAVRRSERRIETKGGKTFTTETFGTGVNQHKVVTEDVGGKPVVRAFTHKGKEYAVEYVDPKKPEKVKSIKDSDGRPMREEAIYGVKATSVSPEGVIRFDNDAKKIQVERFPDGRLTYKSPTLDFSRDTSGLVVDTTVRHKVKGKEVESGFTIDRGPAVPGQRAHEVRNLKFKGTNESLTRNPVTGDYEYRSGPGKDPVSLKGKVTVDPEGYISVNGHKLPLEAQWKDVEAAFKKKPAPDRPVPVPPDRGERRDDPLRPEEGPDPRDPRIARNKDRFVEANRGPNFVTYRDGTTVSVERNGFGTVTTTVDGQSGLATKYSADQRGNLMKIDYPDGTSWQRVATMGNGYEVWTNNHNPAQTCWAKTSGPGKGVDQFGFFRFNLAVRDPFGRMQPVDMVGSPDMTNMYDRQYAFFRRNGYIMPMAPPWMMPARPRFARNPAPPRVLI